MSKKRKFSPGTEEEKNQKAKPNTPQTEKELERRKEEERETRKEEDHNLEEEPHLSDKKDEGNNQDKVNLLIFTNTEYGTTGYFNTSGEHSYTL